MVSVDGELGGDASLRGLVDSREAEGQPRHIGGGALDALDDGDVLGHGGVLGGSELSGGELSGALAFGSGGTLGDSSGALGALGTLDSGVALAFGGGDALGGDFAEQRSVHGVRKFSNLLAV
jgi:hypothetical protein